ncbi:MAG: hypothetical protein B7Y78_07360 [Caulobacter sp. 35-67-4]|nr:MAG: hypothetical protein B7Y81_17460 [Caulobacter sp. 32-67-35]OYX94049.1 MAG: hypothetical protein B7Y78_07360 [Caulobacter sp. 35-67-4]
MTQSATTQPVNDNAAYAAARPSDRSAENENLRPPSQDGEAPRPATEPPGSENSTQSPKTRTDPGSGEN